MDLDFKELDAMVRANCKKEGTIRHFFSPGRLEILGNHTDHNHGVVLVSPASLGIKASVIVRDDRMIAIESKGYGSFMFPIDLLQVMDEEKGSPSSLAKGVTSAMARAGHKIGGYSAVFESSIFPGAGVSSSAAFELMCGTILNELYNDGKVEAVELARIGQYAENVYFGKPSGLLDQCGSAFGGLCYIDFKDPNAPVIQNVEWPFKDLKIVLTNPGLSHGKMTRYYASIPSDMKAAAGVSGHEFLRDVEPSIYYRSIRDSGARLSETAVGRAVHFFEENQRVERALRAIKEKNEGMFLEIIRSSEISSAYLLRNAVVPGQYKKSPLEAVELSNSIINKGATRLMGGGFAGTTLSFLYDDELPIFRKTMEEAYGKGSVVEVEIPDKGAHEVK